MQWLWCVMWLLCVLSDVLMKMPYVDGELPVYWWDSEADRCMVIGIFRHGTYLCRMFYACVLLSVVDVVSMTDKWLPGNTLPRRLLATGESRRLAMKIYIFFWLLSLYFVTLLYISCTSLDSSMPRNVWKSRHVSYSFLKNAAQEYFKYKYINKICLLLCVGYEKYNQIRQDPGLCFLARCGPPDGSALLAEQDDNDDDIK